MKRMHLHLSVPDLAQSIRFYQTLFGAPPRVVKDDYAKWMLDDPRVNFAVSQRGGAGGVNHVGIQVESSAELAELAGRLKDAGAQTFDQTATKCCYAVGDKSWVVDPAGVRWETFHTFGEATTYGEDPAMEVVKAEASPPAACCGAAKPAEPQATERSGAAACCV
ncbi:MAG TPA: ArsI/CadI family heavy metal resistance metalloenzyme [Caulobacteraceae bacterium]|nr:ArsI/CadI family heavy metal resistance metalloenzyme [Caulobacteraceae bacterium]